MASGRCIRCGNMTNGFICDSCQSAMLSQIGGPQTAAGYIPPPATSRVSPWTVVISTVVITLGLATFLLWSKIQSAFDTQPAAVGSALPTADDAALPAALPGPDAGTRPKGPQSTTQTSNTVSNAAPQVSPQSAKEPSVITVPAPRSRGICFAGTRCCRTGREQSPRVPERLLRAPRNKDRPQSAG